MQLVSGKFVSFRIRIFLKVHAIKQNEKMPGNFFITYLNPKFEPDGGVRESSPRFAILRTEAFKRGVIPATSL
jgi:hypothetical protein